MKKNGLGKFGVGFFVLGFLMLVGFTGKAATSNPLATDCIRKVDPEGIAGKGQNQESFWGYFKNNCPVPVENVVFDVLLFRCQVQQPTGDVCYLPELLVLEEEVVLNFYMFQEVKIEQNLPENLESGYYQWDINLKVDGCMDRDHCWYKAKDLPATRGVIFFVGRGVQETCTEGDIALCDTGCGDMVCDETGSWNTNACVEPNENGLCPGDTPLGECQDPPPSCTNCTTPECLETGWECVPTIPPSCDDDQILICKDNQWQCSIQDKSDPGDDPPEDNPETLDASGSGCSCHTDLSTSSIWMFIGMSLFVLFRRKTGIKSK